MDAEYNQVLVKESFEDGLAQGYSEGKAEGRAEGEAKGRAENNRAVAKAFLDNGVSIEIVSKSTGLSMEELARL